MLTENALALLRLYLAGERVQVTAENKEAHRALARAGIMHAVSTFARGPESIFRFSDAGWRRQAELLTAPTAALQA